MMREVVLEAGGLLHGSSAPALAASPALAQAGVDIALGAGTDVAMESADVVLMKSDPYDVLGTMALSRATVRKMKQNLWWAAGYNTIAFPIAAPTMSGSSILVALNALALRWTRLPGIRRREPG